MNNTMRGKAHERGREYEKMVAQILTDHGYTVDLHPDENAHDADMTVNGISIECKGSNPYSYNGNHHAQGFGFTLKKSINGFIKSDMVILFCKADHPALFIIPRADCAAAHFISIPNRAPAAYKGKWAKYLNRFDLLDLAIFKNDGAPRPGAHQISMDVLSEINSQIGGGA